MFINNIASNLSWIFFCLNSNNDFVWKMESGDESFSETNMSHHNIVLDIIKFKQWCIRICLICYIDWLARCCISNYRYVILLFYCKEFLTFLLVSSFFVIDVTGVVSQGRSTLIDSKHQDQISNYLPFIESYGLYHYNTLH